MRNQTFRSLALLVVFVLGGGAVFAQTKTADTPRVFILNGKVLQERQKMILAPTAKDSPARIYEAALKRLIADADKTLKVEVLPVTSKTANPPSGDRHDYMSQAPYFWKNPETKTGFPYVRRDGERNPEILQYPDHGLMDDMVRATKTLSRAYYFTQNEAYAARAAAILRMWFLDAKTKMNPNLEYAQAIPGLNTGRGIGIIESHGLIHVVDSIGLLAGSKAWTKQDQSGLEDWFGKYLKWLTDSKNGKDEAAAKNNHGTIYDVQVASFAMFAGKPEIARTILEAAKQNRIAKQIEPDGKQPLELERTKSWGYSTMNLGGFVELAQLGDAASVDLWSFKTKDGRSIRAAFDYLIPFADGKKKWEYKQIEPLVGEKLYNLMRQSSRIYADEEFTAAMSAVPTLRPNDPDLLILY